MTQTKLLGKPASQLTDASVPDAVRINATNLVGRGAESAVYEGDYIGRQYWRVGGNTIALYPPSVPKVARPNYDGI